MAKLRAVITADIVNSTGLQLKRMKRLQKELTDLLHPYRFDFFRGDSFQVFVHEPKEALRLTLLCRTAARRISEEGGHDIRCSLSIGRVKTTVKEVSTAQDEAFVLSGRAFDTLEKKNRRLVISLPDEEKFTTLNIAFDTLSGYADFLCTDISAKQAAVVFELLSGRSQQEAALHLKKSKSTISELVKAAHWMEIQHIIENNDLLIDQIKSL